MSIRAIVLIVLALSLVSVVARAQSPQFQTGRMVLSAYEDAVAGKAGPDQAKMIEAYVLGLLTAIERTLADERDQGRKPPFCLPADKVLGISDLHATIRTEAKENSNYSKPEHGYSLGFIVVTSYVRRYPCQSVASNSSGEVLAQAEKLTVDEFEQLFMELKPTRNPALVTLTGFSLGFRDGIESMQIRTGASEYDICFPDSVFEAYSSVVLAIKEELRLRRDYWADKRSWSVGPAAMSALKRRNPCKR
jgi:hypothetical protein